MATTRLAANRASSSSKTPKSRKVTVASDSDNDDGESPGLQNVQKYLAGLNESFSALKDEIAALRKRNGELEEELAETKDAAELNRKYGGRKSESAIIKQLEQEVAQLKAENRKKEKTIRKMKKKEVEEEAADLLDTVPDPKTGIDATTRMRKLLRRFNDLMAVTTLGDEDECPVCLEKMTINECSAFDCQHLVCNGCFKQLLPKDENYPCPTCRQYTNREDMELIHMTEQDRWDDLLKVAEAWAAFDEQRPAVDTSEEEDEDSFLRDNTTSGSSETGDVAEVEEDEDEGVSEDEAGPTEDHEPDEEDSSMREGTPPPGNHHRESYLASPTKEKRKRMQELAEQRAKKKRY